MISLKTHKHPFGHASHQRKQMFFHTGYVITYK